MKCIIVKMTPTCVMNAVLIDAQVEEEDLASCCNSLHVQMAGGLCFRAWLIGCIMITTSQHPPVIPLLILVMLRKSKKLEEAVYFIVLLIMYSHSLKKSFLPQFYFVAFYLKLNFCFQLFLLVVTTVKPILSSPILHKVFSCTNLMSSFIPSINLLFGLLPFQPQPSPNHIILLVSPSYFTFLSLDYHPCLFPHVRMFLFTNLPIHTLHCCNLWI